MLRHTCLLLRRRALRPLSTNRDLTLVEQKEGIRTVTLNNPSKYNGWTDPMLRSMMGRFEDATHDEECKALILTGSGAYYCAGVDLSNTLKPMWPKQLHATIYTFNKKVFDTFLNFPKPLCVAVNGPAIGASVTTATLADCVVASTNATFSTPFARLGVPPEGCSSVHFERLMGEVNAERMLGGEGWAPSAAEAAAAGLIDACVERARRHGRVVRRERPRVAGPRGRVPGRPVPPGPGRLPRVQGQDAAGPRIRGPHRDAARVEPDAVNLSSSTA